MKKSYLEFMNLLLNVLSFIKLSEIFYADSRVIILSS